MPENVRCLAWPTSIAGIRDWCLIPCSALQKTTLAVSLEAFLSETGQIERLRPHTLRAYRYELCTNQP